MCRCASTEPDLRLPGAVLAATAEKFKSCARPWVQCWVLSHSHPDKDWPDAHWAEFLSLLRGRASGTVFLVGGRMNYARAQNFMTPKARAPAVNACDLGLTEAAALLRLGRSLCRPELGR